MSPFPLSTAGPPDSLSPTSTFGRAPNGCRASNCSTTVRTDADLYYATELPGPETTIVYTRRGPISAQREPGRLTRDDLDAQVRPDATAYVCGSSGFADAVTGQLIDLGTPTDRIRVERFGPTG